MRKNTNSIFMLAYIAFIFFVVAIKNTIESNAWSHIVVAITVTSSYLAISDFLRTISKVCEQLQTTTASPTASYLRRIKTFRDTCESVDPSILNEKEPDSQLTLREIIKRDEQLSEDTLFRLERLKQRQKTCALASNILLFIAFFLFFCILAIDSVFSHYQQSIDTMSVMAFGYILLAQLGSNYFSGRIKETEEHLREINKNWKFVDDIIEKQEKKNDK